MPARKSSKGTKKKSASKRELINTGTDKRFVRRRSDGTFKESDDVSRSLSGDRRRKAKTTAKRGQGDKADGERDDLGHHRHRRSGGRGAPVAERPSVSSD